jgi:hypothetical protein
MSSRTIIVKSDYTIGDSIGPFRPATSSDTIVDGNNNILNPTYLTISGSYSLLSTDYGLFITASSTPIIVTLPSASGNTNKIYEMIRTDTNGTQVTVSSSNGNISNNSTVGLISQAAVTIISNGTNWYLK